MFDSTRRYGVFESALGRRSPLWIKQTGSREEAEELSKSVAESKGHRCFVFDFDEWRIVFSVRDRAAADSTPKSSE